MFMLPAWRSHFENHCSTSLLLFSHSVMSNSLQSHGLQHTRLPCPFPAHLPEFAQTHIRWVSDAIQPSHPLLSPSPPAFSLSQHQGPFQWVNSLQQVVKVLELQLQHQSFQWIQDWFPLGLAGLISLQSKGLPRVFFSPTVWKHQFVSAQPFLLSNSHICTWLPEKP